MSAALLIELAWKSALLAGVTLLALRLLSGRSAAERSWVAHAGVAALLLLPLVVVAGPRWQVEAPPAMARALGEPAALAVVAPRPAPVSAEPSWGRAPAPPVPPMQASPASTDAGTTGRGSNIAPAVLYGLPALLLLCTMLLAVVRLFGLRRRAMVVTDPQWVMAMARAQQRLKFNRGAALLLSDEINSPLSWGMVQPVIALDPRSVADASQAEAIIAHELAHLDRLDWTKLLLGRLATALFWFNPLVWRLARECHQLREEAVDDAVLSADVRGDVYAAVLVQSARRQTSGALLAANGVAPAFSSLKQRVARVLEPTLRRVPASTGFAASCAAAALLLAAPLAALSPVAPQHTNREPAAEAAPAAPSAPPARSSSAAAAFGTALGARIGNEATAIAEVATAAALTAATDALTAADPAGSFSEVELHSGGTIRIRHGATHGARVIAGDADAVSRRAVRPGRLSVTGCDTGCELELTTPGPLNALSITGSGRIVLEGAFPSQPRLAAAINGAGRLDSRALPADAVVAAVDGRGTILTHARSGLVAATSGGGDIVYLGEPRVQASASGGGVIRQATPDDG